MTPVVSKFLIAESRVKRACYKIVWFLPAPSGLQKITSRSRRLEKQNKFSVVQSARCSFPFSSSNRFLFLALFFQVSPSFVQEKFVNAIERQAKVPLYVKIID